MSGVAIRTRRSIPPAEIKTPKEAEIEIRAQGAILALLRKGRADLKRQVQVIRRILEYSVRGADLVDEMRERGELVHSGGGGAPPEVRGVLTLAKLELDDRRVSEWFSLRDNGAIEFIDQAIADSREETFRKASVNWIRDRCERIAREREAKKAEAGQPAYDNEMRHGDLRDTLNDLIGQVDAIITDPPYGEDFLGEYDALGDVATRLLMPDGLLAAMVGHAHLPDHLQRLGHYMTYRWCGAYLMGGAGAVVFGREIARVQWKPIVIFDRNNERRRLGRDAFYSADREKPLGGQIDGWQQSVSGMIDIIDQLTLPGQLVVDPFMGAGTTAIACKKLGRRFIGCDKSADAVNIARQRMAEFV